MHALAIGRRMVGPYQRRADRADLRDGRGRAMAARPSSVSPAPPQVVLPLLVHANGKHYRLHERPLAPLLQRLLSPGLEERRRIERYPVLLIDSVAMGTCGVATLGSVLRGSKTRTVERAQSG